MSDDLDRLLAVQDLDTAITQLQRKRAALAEKSGLVAVEAALAAVAAEQADARARRAALVATQKDLEEQIAVINERRGSIEQRMYAARGSSTRDLQAMDEEVRHLVVRRAGLEELELAAMVEQEPIDAELAALSTRQTPLAGEADALRIVMADGETEIDAELAAAITARAAQAALLPTALSDHYETLRARLKGTGAARLIGHRCDGCHLELSSVEVEKIRALARDTVVTCDQCGRILVPS